MAPCGNPRHPIQILGGRVVVCELACDIVWHIQNYPALRCPQCHSTRLRPHSFGDDAVGQWHAILLPRATICADCNHVSLDGGTR